MLQQFHASDQIESARRLARQGLGGLHAVVELQALAGLATLQQMQAGDIDEVGGQVDAQHLGTLAGHRLAEQAATTTDIENPRAGQWALPGHVGQSGRIEGMQRTLRPLWIPPARGEGGKSRQLGGVGIGGDRRGGGAHRDAPGRGMSAMRRAQARALALSTPVSMSVRRRSRSFGRPAIQTSLTWWRVAT